MQIRPYTLVIDFPSMDPLGGQEVPSPGRHSMQGDEAYY